MQDNLSFPLICPDWNADEEILLLEVSLFTILHILGAYFDLLIDQHIWQLLLVLLLILYSIGFDG